MSDLTATEKFFADLKKRVGELDYHGSDGMFYVEDVFTLVDELVPGRLLQFIKTALRSEKYKGTRVFDRYYSLSDIISAYLTALKQRTETLLDEKIDGVTLGRPVQFSQDPVLDHNAQETLLQAALEAGFKQVDFELEPIAAALYYELTLDKPQNVLIFDFGGGTLDLTIIRLSDPHKREIFASGGIGIAGSDFDRAIIQTRMLHHFGKGLVQHDPEITRLIDTIPDWSALPELSTPRARAELERAIRAGEAPVRLKALESLIFNDLAFSFYNAVEAAKILGTAEHITCLDPSAGMLSVAKQKLHARFIQAGAESIPLPDESFDFLTMGYALRHVRSLDRAFDEYHPVLAPGGKLLLLEITKPSNRVGAAEEIGIVLVALRVQHLVHLLEGNIGGFLGSAVGTGDNLEAVAQKPADG